VKELLDGKWWLLLTFANFLPLDHGDRLRREVEPKHHAEKEKLRNMQFTAGEAFDQSQDLVGRIKARFQGRNEENVYDAILATCNKYAKGEKTRDEVLQEVADLFLPEHADFLNEFRFFLQV
jgi:histone deacetylase complex regulatory component SIN3